MEIRTGKSQRGGARAGAGRKPTGRRSCTVRLSPEVEAILDSVEGSRSDCVSSAPSRGKAVRPIGGLSQFGTLNNGLPNQREVVFMRGRKFRVLSHMKLQNSPCGYEFLLEEV